MRDRGPSTLAIIISVFSLIVSGLSFWESNRSANRSHNLAEATATHQILDEWLKTGNALPSADECFAFANDLQDSAFDKLFAKNSEAFDFEKRGAQSHLKRCISSAPASNHVDHDEAFEIRKIITTKLNSFQVLYQSAALGDGYKKELCDGVKNGFDSGPRKFVERVIDEVTKPALLETMGTDLNYVVEVTRHKLCHT